MDRIKELENKIIEIQGERDQLRLLVEAGRQDAELLDELQDTGLTFREAVQQLKGERDALRAALNWQPIETAPKMQTILMFAVTDRAEDGTVRNWRMATGFIRDGGMQSDELPIEWDGHRLKVYEHQPTHWMPLPKPPVEATLHPNKVEK